MSHEDCLFCKISKGEIPSAKIYEDEQVYAFLDLSQVTKGHTLLIPKTHAKNIYEIAPEQAGELFSRVPKIARAIKETYGAIGMNVLNNNEAPADQSVFHLHLHLIPRYGEGDGYSSNWITHGDDYSQDQLQKIAQEIASAVN